MPARLGAVLLAGWLVVGCGGIDAGAAAVVNGTRIGADELERLVESGLASAQQDLSALSAEERAQAIGEQQRGVLTSLIRIEIVAQVADAEGIEITEADLDERFAQEAEAQGGEDALEQALEQSGLTVDDFRELVLADLVRQEALEAQLGGEISDEELRTAYEERREQGQYEQATLRHILVETEQEAEQILERLENGGDFGDLARARSQDPGSAERGGELGTQPLGGFVEPFAQAVREAEEGALVGPVQTEFGFHVIRVDELVSPSFEEVRDQLRQELAQTAGQGGVQQAVAAAIAEGQIEVASRFGTWDPRAGQVIATDLLRDGRGGQPPPGGQPGTPAPEGQPATPAPTPTG